MTGVEIEIKAAVTAPRELHSRLDRLGTFVRSYRKEDRYYGLSREAPETKFRLRRDGDQWICTRKSKNVRDAVEESVELEFLVSDGALFDQFARDLGYALLFEKQKTGERWEVEGTTVEVSQVNDLGIFVEVELVLDQHASPAERESARTQVRAVLDLLGIPASAIEERTYTRMIYENLSPVTTTQSNSL
jgi:adenylate cyclase, class 2